MRRRRVEHAADARERIENESAKRDARRVGAALKHIVDHDLRLGEVVDHRSDPITDEGGHERAVTFRHRLDQGIVQCKVHVEHRAVQRLERIVALGRFPRRHARTAGEGDAQCRYKEAAERDDGHDGGIRWQENLRTG